MQNLLQGTTQEDVGPPGTWQEPALKQAILEEAQAYEIELADLHLALSVEQLWLALMTTSQFMEDFQRLRRYHSLDIGHWRREGAGASRQLPCALGAGSCVELCGVQRASCARTSSTCCL